MIRVDLNREYKQVYFAGEEINALFLGAAEVGESIVDQAVLKGLDVDVFNGDRLDNYMIRSNGVDIMGYTDNYIFILEYPHGVDYACYVLFGTSDEYCVESLLSSLLEFE